MAIISAFAVPHPPLAVIEDSGNRDITIGTTLGSYNKAASMIRDLDPETIIITSPHTVMYSDYFHVSPGSSAKGDLRQFGLKDISFQADYDVELRDEIVRLCEESDFPAGTMGERDRSLDHGTMVPLYFINKYFNGAKIIRIGLSGQSLRDHYRFGQIIGNAVENTGRKVVFVASGDLSHKLQKTGPYGFAPEGPVYDAKITDVFESGDFGKMFGFDEELLDKAAECGHRSFVIMAGALDGKGIKPTLFSHEDTTGVGYGIASFEITGEDGSRKYLDKIMKDREETFKKRLESADPYVRLAYKTIEAHLSGIRPDVDDSDLPKEMLTGKAGTFVSVHEDGKLRGCMGTFLPTEDSVKEEIMSNAISAVSRDPRFSPVTRDEFMWLDINVDVLSEPEDIDSESELDVKKYGVIVTSGRKRGLLLPDLDGVDTVEDQIDIACRKAGIGPGEKIALKRFEVVRHF